MFPWRQGWYLSFSPPMLWISTSRVSSLQKAMAVRDWSGGSLGFKAAAAVLIYTAGESSFLSALSGFLFRSNHTSTFTSTKYSEIKYEDTCILLEYFHFLRLSIFAPQHFEEKYYTFNISFISQFIYVFQNMPLAL